MFKFYNTGGNQMKTKSFRFLVFFCFFLFLSVAYTEVINPGGAGMLGTVNYISGNIALRTTVNSRGGSTTSSIDGIDPYYCWGASATGGNDGAGQNASWSPSYSWHIDNYNKTPTSPSFFKVNFGDISGVANTGKQEYAVSRIDIYGRTDSGCGTQFRGNVYLFDSNNTNVSTNQITGDSSVQSLARFSYSGLGMISRGIDYRPGGSFNELEVYGMNTLTLGAQDSINIELSNSGNDFMYVQGNATLNGQINFSSLNSFVPSQYQTFNIMTASSIDASNLTVNGNYTFSVISGGNGQILQATAIPEPASLTLCILFLAFFAAMRRKHSE